MAPFFLLSFLLSLPRFSAPCETCEEDEGRLFQPSMPANRYIGTNTYSSSSYGYGGSSIDPYVGALSSYSPYGFRFGGQSGPSAPYNGGGRVRWSIGTYEITGYLKENQLGGINQLFGSDGYINPETRPRCPLINYDTLRGPPIGPSRSGYAREHRQGRILENDFEIEVQNSYEDLQSPYDDGSDSEGRWFFNPFRQSLSNNYFRYPQSLASNYIRYQQGVGSSVSPVPAPSVSCGGCTWEAELVCQLSVTGEDVRWTRYHDGIFYPPGRYHDILDYFGSRARIDTVEDGSLSKLVIYTVFPGDKGTYACETWNWGESDGFGLGGGDVRKEILTIDFYPQFPMIGAPVC